MFYELTLVMQNDRHIHQLLLRNAAIVSVCPVAQTDSIMHWLPPCGVSEITLRYIEKEEYVQERQ